MQHRSLPRLSKSYYLLGAVVLLMSFCSYWQPWSALRLASAPESVHKPHANMIVWTADALTKIRTNLSCPDKPGTSINLSAARNEYEPFQIVVGAGEQPLKLIDIEASPLTSANNRAIAAKNITIYREAFINVTTPSNIEGQTGLWPDALIPKNDSFFGEKRNGFPFDLEPQKLQPIWLDIFVPPDTAAGDYSGRVKILSGDKEIAAVDVKLHVWNFEIPSTSSLPNSFGFSGSTVLQGHYGKYTSDEDILKLTDLYSKAALQHRISLHGGSGIPPIVQADGNSSVKIDWERYDREISPFLDGKALPSGARFTSIDLRTPSALNDIQKIEYWKQYAKHFREKGWFDRLFDYTWDEPSEADFDKINVKSALIKRADPQLACLVTKELHPKLKPAVNIWTVVINYIDDKPGNSNVPARDVYDREKAGKLWWYQSCMSHGCNVVGEEYFTGWPAYIIDLPAIYSRIMPWAAWKYRIGGELYFNTVEAYQRMGKPNGDPWNNQYLFGGNGDGTLFYPGRPDKIGGRDHIPVESIRLKLIREGLEDYEYMRLAAAKVNQQAANKIVDRIVTKTYVWDHEPQHLMDARTQLANLIETK